MAKLTFTDTQDSKNLYKTGTDLYIRDSTVYSRTRNKPPKQFIYNPTDDRFKRSYLRQIIHDLAREISERWQSLSDEQKSSWLTYSSYPPYYISGYKAFYSNNIHLKRPNHVCLGWIDDITSPPDPPVTPSGICIQFMSIDSFFCVSWTTPNDVNTFIQAFNWSPPGRKRRLSQPFLYSETVHSSDSLLSIDIIELDKSRHSMIMLRSLNLRGEITESIDITEMIKNSWPPGRYGIARYAYSVYGPTG